MHALGVEVGTAEELVGEPDESESHEDAMLVLKDSLGLDQTAALRGAKVIPGPVWTGSQVEAEWLRRHLARRGIAAVSSRVPTG